MGELTRLLLSLAVVLLAAKVGAVASAKVRQPPVLGELLAGVALGSVGLERLTGLDFGGHTPVMHALGELGVVVLLFEVGLESKAGELLRLGRSALGVALVGVIAPLILGTLLGRWLLPRLPLISHLFLGATLAATSVGITARVFRDLNALQRPEARLVLGAAVIDDVLGLLLLAVVSGMVTAAGGGGFGWVGLAWVVAKAAIFLLGALALGLLGVPHAFALARRIHGVSFTLALVLCLLLAALAEALGLAAIVGAFAAGLMLEQVPFEQGPSEARPLPELILPLSTFLVPLFFVEVGARVDVGSLGAPPVLALAGALTLAAMAGKQVSGLLAPREMDWLSVGLAMVPRGEVGLIFANLGTAMTLGGEPVLGRGAYSAVVAMVMVTTLVTPPALRWSLQRAR